MEEIYFDFETKKFVNITLSQVKFWEGCYPDVDIVDQILFKAPAWLDAYPKRRTYKRWKAFLVNWFRKGQAMADGRRKYAAAIKSGNRGNL
jgi:hypothetical protein